MIGPLLSKGIISRMEKGICRLSVGNQIDKAFIFGAILKTGVASPDVASLFLLARKRAGKKGRPCTLPCGFPALQECFEDGQKLASLRQSARLFLKTPFPLWLRHKGNNTKS